MGSAASNPQVVYFADCSLDLRTAELRRNGTTVTLQDQPFQILTALLETPGQLVTREELVKKLWPSGTFVDFDQSLNKAVARLREALGDNAEQPRFVETLPRRGYRWIGTLHEPRKDEEKATQSAAPPVAPGDTPSETRPSNSGRKLRLLGYVALSILALAVLVAWTFLRYWPAQNQTSTVTPIRSLAVLPLESLSDDPAQRYFADGITEELIERLTRMSTIRVISRASVMNYSDARKTLPEIGRELHVDGILEGSVVRIGDRVRVRIQLTNTAHNEQRWSATYERGLQDIMELQADAARDIAGEIKLELTRQELAWLSQARKVNPEAHELYLKGRYFWNKRDQPGVNKAIEYFQLAIAKDPAYAEAYAGLADAYLMVPGFATGPPGMSLPKAKAAAEKALQLDDALAEAHTSLALIASHLEWNWPEAKRHYQRALELNPSYATAHHWCGEAYLFPLGNFPEAFAEMRKAQELDPLSPIIASDIGKNLVMARRYDEAIAMLNKTLELDPNFSKAHQRLFYAYMEKGSYNEALTHLELCQRYIGKNSYDLDLAFLEAKLGSKEKARAILDPLLRKSDSVYVNPVSVAHVYIALGEKDSTLAWLEKAVMQKHFELVALKVDSEWDPIRSDPRFRVVADRVGMPQ